MSLLELKLATILPAYIRDVQGLVRDYGSVAIGSVNAAQASGGMRGVNALVCDTSEVDPCLGLIIRGRQLKDLTDRLPEEIFWLLLTGELPTEDDLTDLQIQIQARAYLPPYILAMLRAMPEDSHPMAMLSAALTAMNRESAFAYRIWNKNYDRFWALMLEDALRLLGRLPLLAATIYRLKYHRGELIEPDPHLDLGANFARMLGLQDSETIRKLIRLYMVVHSDHESGNATAYATLTAASALNDPYLSLAAGMNALAGPLHGLASERALAFLTEFLESGVDSLSAEAMEQAVRKHLEQGRVLHGFGHAVLRIIDPRLTALRDFANQHFPGEDLLAAADLMCEAGARVLAENTRIQSPWPNIDAVSGAVLTRAGIRETEFFTVMFGVGLSTGLLAQLVLMRALNTPMIRPKSVTTDWIRKFVEGNDS